MASTRKPWLATSYFDMMRHIYAKPKGHSEGLKPYMEDTFFDMEYPRLKKYGGNDKGIGIGEEPPIDPIPEIPPECLEWFEQTIIVSGNTYFQNPAFINKIYSELDACTKLHLVITSCLQYNSLSFCICCASAALIAGGGFTTQSTCAKDFGPVADEPWKCCNNPCPSFSIEELSRDASKVCYKAVADCDIRVSWEKKTAWGPWEATEEPCLSAATGPCGTPAQKLKATDLCRKEVILSLPASGNPAVLIECASPPCDVITKSSSKQYNASCACAQAAFIWSVSGTGASIDQSGLLTTNATACGTLTIRVDVNGCQPSTQEVRVTDAGTWTWVSQDAPPVGCGYGANCGGGVCTVISGGNKTTWHDVQCQGAGSLCGAAPCNPGCTCTSPAKFVWTTAVNHYTWGCA